MLRFVAGTGAPSSGSSMSWWKLPDGGNGEVSVEAFKAKIREIPDCRADAQSKYA